MIGISWTHRISYLATGKDTTGQCPACEPAERGIILSQHFKTQEESNRIYDESLTSRWNVHSLRFSQSMTGQGRSCPHGSWGSKTGIGGEMELYVIDENATIVATTYPVELGLNFSEFRPYFADYLGTIRLSSGFFPDRIVSEKSTGNMRKFAYMPSPDPPLCTWTWTSEPESWSHQLPE